MSDTNCKKLRVVKGAEKTEATDIENAISLFQINEGNKMVQDGEYHFEISVHHAQNGKLLVRI